MNFRPVTFYFHSFFLVFFITLFLFYSSARADKEPQFYTIQAGSYAGEQGALQLYQDIADILPESQRSYLRVERIGSYFTVRVGKLESREAAEELFSQAEQYLPNSMILQAYIKDERIIRIYQPVSEINLALESEQAALFAEQEMLPPAELPSVETGVSADVAAVDADMPLPEPVPDAFDSDQENSDAGTNENLQSAVTGEVKQPAVTGEVQRTVVIDVAGQNKEKIEQVSAKKEVPAIAQDEEKAQLEMSATSDAPAEVIEEEDLGTEETETAATVEQQDLTPGDDEPTLEQGEIVPEDNEAEGPVADETSGEIRRFDRLGQPTGFSSVRTVAILTKNIFGGKYRYPNIVHYDPIMDEIFVIGGGGMHPSTRIMIYGPDYYQVASLGEGRGVLAPTGLALDDEGNIYIGQSSSHGKGGHLKVLNPAFFLVHEVIFSDYEEVPDDFTPGAVAISEQYIYLSGLFIKGVLVLDRNYNFVRWLVPIKKSRKKGEIGNDLTHPNAQSVNDVVVDRNGRVYILCPELGSIYVLDAEWNFLFAFGTKGGSSGKLSRPRSLAVDVEREAIYVVDYMRHAVNIYTYAEGNYLFEVGGMGETPGWFKYPTHVEIDGRGNLIVADYFNHRVQVLLVP